MAVSRREALRLGGVSVLAGAGAGGVAGCAARAAMSEAAASGRADYTLRIATGQVERLSFTPGPAGYRFYHTHVAARGDLTRGTYSGQADPVHIEPKTNPDAYDQEVFLTLKEFEPPKAGVAGSNPAGGTTH
ncbi:hypothetical protein AB5J72_02175 [Streptomyces sp. CG1]|uniref:hypothetical protein n=1 Tax=Streptomyces sp. CG1 TaxID=1287523 RepID=UPI0034E2B34D